jgi:hypothetical protein
MAAFGVSLSASAVASVPSSTDTLILGPPTNPANPTYGNVFRDEEAPVIASNGAGSLVAWADGSVNDPSANPVVACTRFDTSGAVVDSPPIALSLHGAPSVVWDGTQYLVAAGGFSQHVNAATGAVDTPFAFASGVGFERPAVMASGGGAIVSVGANSSGQAMAFVFDSKGVFKSSVTLGSSSDFSVAVGYAAGEFLAAWPDHTVLRAARISAAGALLDATPITIAGATPPPEGGVAPIPGYEDVAGSNTGFLVSWASDTGRAARVGADGKVADPEGIIVAGNTGVAQGVHAMWNGSTWWMTWLDHGPAMVMESLDANGKLGWGGVVLNPTFASTFVGAGSGSSFLLAWDEGGQVKGTAVNVAGASPVAGSPTLISRFNELPRQLADDRLDPRPALHERRGRDRPRPHRAARNAHWRPRRLLRARGGRV